jgi:hypothetical protein
MIPGRTDIENPQRLDDERPGQMGAPTRSNHQDLAVRPLRRENRFQWWWDVGRVGAGLKVIWEISVYPTRAFGRVLRKGPHSHNEPTAKR